MNRRPPRLSPHRLLAWLLLPLGAYLVIRAVIGSATGALAITEAVPATWLLVVGIARRRCDPIAVLSTLTVAIALAAYALTGGDPLALKLRRGAVTGTLAIATLASVALGRPLLLIVAEHTAKLSPEHQLEIQTRLAEPDRRRAMTILTAIIGLTFAIDAVPSHRTAVPRHSLRFDTRFKAATERISGLGADCCLSTIKATADPAPPSRCWFMADGIPSSTAHRPSTLRSRVRRRRGPSKQPLTGSLPRS
jgi:hypothetical protein